MPGYIVKQPNGKFARFSTVVDDFTHLNMDEDEVRECMLADSNRRALEEASRQLFTANHADSTRWEDCLRTRENVHGLAPNSLEEDYD